jgi:hypothetical protein
MLIISAGMFAVILRIILFFCERLNSQNIKLTRDGSCSSSIDSLYGGTVGFEVLNSNIDEGSCLLGWDAMSAVNYPYFA